MLKKWPKSLVQFQRMFPDEQACADYIRAIRWPDPRFVCPHCGGYEGRQEAKRPLLFGCKACGKQTSLTAQTVLHRAKLPLPYWFWAAYLLATHSNGLSALQLQKQLGLSSYKSAWLLMSKLRQCLVDPDRKKLNGFVEVDEFYIRFRRGSETRQGKSAVGRLSFIIAVEVVEYTAKDGTQRTRAGRTRIEVLPDGTKQSLHAFIHRNVEVGSFITTDGNPAYRKLRGFYLRQLKVMGQDKDKILLQTNRVISLLKTLGLGIYHGFRARYIQRYLDEFVWRFNRRGARPATFHMIIGRMVQTQPRGLPDIRTDLDDLNGPPKGPPPPGPFTLPGGMIALMHARFAKENGYAPPFEGEEINDDSE
jgi:transposase-like protein